MREGVGVAPPRLPALPQAYEAYGAYGTYGAYVHLGHLGHMTLDHVTLWPDRPGCRAAAYVAMSWVGQKEPD